MLWCKRLVEKRAAEALGAGLASRRGPAFLFMGAKRRDLRDRWEGMQALPLALLLLFLRVAPAAAGALERAMLGKSQVVDLTQAQTEPAHAGKVQEGARPEGPGEGERNNTPRHIPPTGQLVTHLDLPSSVLRGKPTIAQIPARDLLAYAVVVDVTARVSRAADYRVTTEDLQVWERRNGRIPRGSMVLLNMGWGRRWNGNDPARYVNLDPQGMPHVPGISPAAITFLLNEREIRGVGFDSWVPEAAPGASGNGDAT